jgi:hypothetical protein
MQGRPSKKGNTQTETKSREAFHRREACLLRFLSFHWGSRRLAFTATMKASQHRSKSREVSEPVEWLRCSAQGQVDKPSTEHRVSRTHAVTTPDYTIPLAAHGLGPKKIPRIGFRSETVP